MAKGKKKKQQNKKVKKKHVHKKTNLRILSYYKVDGDKVARLKRMCEVCPPGTFLAEHEDSVLTIRKLIHPIYGECLISKGVGNEQIKLWGIK